MTRDARPARKAEWQLLFLSTGELGLEAHVQAVEKRLYGGQAIRFCEIPARANDQFGAFDWIHEFRSSKEFADHLNSASHRYYGSAARAFLHRIAEHEHEAITKHILELKEEFSRAYIPLQISAEVVRAGDRFALVYKRPAC
jgi:putative DNA primase/helicase